LFRGGVPSGARTAQPKANGNAQPLPSGVLGGGGGGRPLPEDVRGKMESFFGADLSDVRIHVGSEAPKIGALAFTLGSNLYFAPGQLDLQSHRGHELLGHELTHVIQQRAGRVRNPFWPPPIARRCRRSLRRSKRAPRRRKSSRR
jgi:hypothetical protein